jgi:spermidine synthase
LLGVAVGSLAAGVWARRGPDASLRAVPLLFAVSSALYYVSLPIGARLVAYSPDFGLSACYGLVVLVACSTGAVFPSLCHFAIRSPKAVGLPVSRIYFANILGSTAGPLLTGLVLSQWLTLEHNTLALAIVGTAFALWASYAGALRGSVRSAFSLALAAAMAAAVFTHERTYRQLLERLYYKDLYGYRRAFSRVVQNRSGIVSVIPDEPDTLLGGGIYDGRFSTDVVQDANAIRRAYMVAGLHRDPQDVLEVGLGSGSWTRAILDSDLVHRLTVVEINPAYSSLLRFYPDVADLLDDPRVTLVVDDGRRWIRRHPDARFDIIVMNTTFHWRNMSTNLLSADFLRMCKSHLKPGGVIYYNSTGSPHVFYTAARLFRHVVQYLNFVAGSDALFDITREERRANLLRFHRGERTIFDERRIDLAKALDRISEETLLDLGERLRARSDLWLITDDNMATEFKTRLGGQATSLR